MIDLANTPCPVCGETRSDFFNSTTYPEHHYPGQFVLRRCPTCGLLFNSPRLDLKELGELYGKNYYFFLRDDARELNRIVAMVNRTVAELPSDLPKGQCVDIGCGRGYFPAVLRELGYDAHGIEIADEAAAEARQKFGLDVFTGTVEQYAASDSHKTFPLVTAIDVIEHVPEPRDFVAACAKILQSGGRLIVDTPNGGAANITSKGLSWKGFNPFHVYLFTIENLSKLLEQNGLIVETSFSYGNAAEGTDLRDTTIATLKNVGLLGPMVSGYFAMKKMTMGGGGPTKELVSQAAEQARKSSKYSVTPDASDTLAANHSGDNILIIARKA